MLMWIEGRIFFSFAVTIVVERTRDNKLSDRRRVIMYEVVTTMVSTHN